jgi:hypothetical protein
MADGKKKNKGIIYSGLQISPDARRDIFISYRHVGGGDFASSMNTYLVDKHYNVFYDIDDMKKGRLSERLLYVIRNCIDYLLVLPPNGLDRCKETDDWLRTEIECAINNKKNIIPIMLNGFDWPKRDTLPESLQNLQDYMAVKHSHENFEHTMQQLIDNDMLHSKPFFINVDIIDKSPRHLLLERFIIALITFAIGIGGTLITQRLLPHEQVSHGNTPLTVTEMIQTPPPTATEQVIVTSLIDGSAIDKAVRGILDIPSGGIPLEEAVSITEMNLSGLSLTGIDELAEFTSLKTLDLHNNRISDLTPLSVMAGLESLYIYNNQITSLQPLSAMKNLKTLSAEDNQIVDVSPLAELTSLQKLFLQGNLIVDVSPLKNLVKLTWLALDGNPITDYTPLVNFPTTVFKIPQE